MEGFIRTPLELRLLILYIAARLIEPADFATLQELTMCDDAIGYFDFTEALSALTATGHLSENGDGRYAITEKGRRNGQTGEGNIPYSVRLKCDRAIAVCNRSLRRSAQVRASVTPGAGDATCLRLELEDDYGPVMDLKLSVLREDLAHLMAKRYKENPEHFYDHLLAYLLKNDEEEEP